VPDPLRNWRPRAVKDQAHLEQVEAFADEAYAKKDVNRIAPKLEDLETGRRILAAEPVDQVQILCAAFALLCRGSDGVILPGERFFSHDGLDRLVLRFLRKRLPFRAEDFAAMVRGAAATRYTYVLPLGALLHAIERYAGENDLEPPIREALTRLRRNLGEPGHADSHKITERLRRLLDAGNETAFLVPNPWGKEVKAWLADLGSPARESWIALLEHAAGAAKNSRPAEQWLGTAGGFVKDVGEGDFSLQLEAWLDGFKPDPERREPNTELIKGLIWASAAPDGDRMSPLISRFCEVCFRKIPGIGPASVKLGNACIHALGAMAGERAAAELVRLRSRIKFNQGRKQLDKAILMAAERAGLSVEDLEEMALPDFGLGPDGSLQEELGGCIAEIRIAGSDQVTLSWTGADGKPRKAVPAAVKADHAGALKELRARVKEIKGLLSAQRWRLESLYLQERSWPLAEWRKRYLDHPLLSNLSRRLIWRFAEGDHVVTAIPVGDGLVAADGRALDWPGETAEVSLWHPIGSPADRVLAWRKRLADLEVTQPFKQAHREIYLLTDAERRTDIYSNRFAAHILKQHQLNALCQARAWHYGLRGAWDAPENVPTRLLPHCRLKAEFWLDPVEYEQHTDVGVYLYIGTDQVRFQDEHGQVLHLEEVPSLVFSEVMRDVDLFVGVASVANDPTWQDGGPEGRHRDYWLEHSFGDLSESAKTRHAVLAGLIPKLKIADRCALEDKFLVVRGTKRRYKIHLGSGNILMAPNDQYLCIVKGWDKAADKQKIRLPFEGDGTLSMILSKAFLLAADDKITDPGIRSQIGF
jgi:hypothetical protein